MGQHLVDTPARHHVAGDEQGERIESVIVLLVHWWCHCGPFAQYRYRQGCNCRMPDKVPAFHVIRNKSRLCIAFAVIISLNEWPVGSRDTKSLVAILPDSLCIRP